jgi:hypothetical protein
MASSSRAEFEHWAIIVGHSYSEGKVDIWSRSVALSSSEQKRQFRTQADTLEPEYWAK